MVHVEHENLLYFFSFLFFSSLFCFGSIDGTILKFVQGVLDPLQQTAADGCHLIKKTGKNIFEAGLSDVDINTVFLSNAFFVNPRVYG